MRRVKGNTYSDKSKAQSSVAQGCIHKLGPSGGALTWRCASFWPHLFQQELAHLPSVKCTNDLASGGLQKLGTHQACLAAQGKTSAAACWSMQACLVQQQQNNVISEAPAPASTNKICNHSPAAPLRGRLPFWQRVAIATTGLQQQGSMDSMHRTKSIKRLGSQQLDLAAQ
eukprot:1160970-Pelagomonas_calceolata.AAC.5